LIGLLIKIIVCPAVVILASYLISGLSYLSLYQTIIIGLVLAAFNGGSFIKKRHTLA
jgi:hypothetical protein